MLAMCSTRSGDVSSRIFACGSQAGAHQERDEQQEPQRQHRRERQHIIAREVLNPGIFRIFHLPDNVERVFKLHDDANRGEK